jgi:glycosyltransferase involved in cell wall biosynthesis
MITFIIPTLWKSNKIYDTISSVKRCQNQDIELIIIDNTNSDYESDDHRIKVIKQKQNIFVNPAWNLGVSISKNQYVCLLNDDLSLNVTCLLNNFESLVKSDPDFGAIGLYKRNFNVDHYNDDNDKLSLVGLDSRAFGFGCMMIFKKENYIEIPECFEVFFGDDYLYYYNKDLFGRKIYWIENLKTPGEISITSRSFEDSHMQQEYKFWDAEINSITSKIKSDKYKN